MATCSSAPRSNSSMNGSPAISLEKRVQRAQSTQRSRSSSTVSEILIGFSKRRLVSTKRVSPGPWARVWSWRGHSPPLSHMGQSSGWLISSSSRLPSWPALATSEVTWVLTSMPSVTVVVQAVSGLRWPATSTRHWRQAPRGASSRWSQKRGTIVPSCSAARITSVPGGTSSSWPSMVIFTVVGLSAMRLLVGANGDARPREGAAAAADVLVELVAEELQGGDDRAGRPVAQGALEVAGVDDVAGDAEQLRAGRLLRAHGTEPVDALADDPGHGGHRLDVVDGGRGPVQALDGREGRAQLGLAALALQRGQQGRLLAADVGPGATVHDQVQVEPGALDVAAQQPLVVGGVDRRLEPAARPAALAPQVDEGVAAADGVGGDDHALDQGVRVALEQLHVLEGAGLALVGVDHQVGRLAGPLGQEAPLHAGREAGPATAPQPGVLDQLDQVLGRLPEGGVEAGVAVQLTVAVDLMRPVVPPAGGQHLDLLGHGPSPDPSD